MKNIIKIDNCNLYAWMGMDELGSNEFGIKGAIVPAGYIPLVAIKKEKMLTNNIPEQLQLMSTKYKNNIYLCEFHFNKIEETIIPKTT